MTGQLPLRPVAITLDFIIIVLSFYLSYLLRCAALQIIPFGADTEFKYYYGFLLSILVLWIWLFTLLGSYRRPMFVSMQREIKAVSKVVFLGSLILFTALFFLKDSMSFLPRSLMFIFIMLNICLLISEKFLLFAWVNGMRKKGQKLLQMVIVGDTDKAAVIAEQLAEHPELGLKPLGIFSDTALSENKTTRGILILGKTNELAEFLHKNHVDEVALAVNSKEKLNNLLKVCKEEGVKTRLISDIFNDTNSDVAIEKLGNLVSITLFQSHEKEWQFLIKRLMDICLSSLLLVLLAPLLLLISIIIKLTSPGPILYEWNVLGFNKEPFKSWKFRTMVVNADKLKEKLESKNEMTGTMFKMKDDPRIIPAARIWRKFSLDELPQLVSVLKGDMSLVGPRPPLVDEADKFDHWHGRKLRMKPGITCLWQVKGRNEIRDFDEWVKLDLEYIENWSLWLDISILLKTIPVVLGGSGR